MRLVVKNDYMAINTMKIALCLICGFLIGAGAALIGQDLHSLMMSVYAVTILTSCIVAGLVIFQSVAIERSRASLNDSEYDRYDVKIVNVLGRSLVFVLGYLTTYAVFFIFTA